MVAEDKRPADEMAGLQASTADRIAVTVADGYLFLRMGPKFAEHDLPDAFDRAAIDSFIDTGMKNEIDRLLIDVTGSSQSFGINTFRCIAEAHKRKRYRAERVAVFSHSKAEFLRVELAGVVVKPAAGEPEVRSFVRLSDAVDWLTGTAD